MSNSTIDSSVDSITHAKLKAWIEEIAALTKPDAVKVLDGSAEEYDALCQQLVDKGVLIIRVGEIHFCFIFIFDQLKCHG